MVMSADHPGLTFTLSLVRTEPTYNQPMQQWSFISDFAVSLVPFLITLFYLFHLHTVRHKINEWLYIL